MIFTKRFFTGAKCDQNFKNFHAFGSPEFVLNPAIQRRITNDKEADVMMKPLAKDNFEKFRKLIMG